MPGTSNPTPRFQWILVVTGAVALVNFLAFYAQSISIGGDALNGYVDAERHFVCSHGVCTEVTEAVWNSSYRHAWTAIAGILLVFVEAAVFVAIRRRDHASTPVHDVGRPGTSPATIASHNAWTGENTRTPVNESPSVALLLQPLLGPGERLLWSGRPRQGLRLQLIDLLLVPFSLAWGGGALVWEAMALAMATRIPAAAVPGYFALIFPLFGLPFVAIGLYMMIGRFFADSWSRARTAYGVTNERVIIVAGMWKPTIQSLSLATLTGVSFTEKKDGSGTIVFGTVPAVIGALIGTGWPVKARHVPPCLDSIAGVRGVFDLLTSAQRARSG